MSKSQQSEVVCFDLGLYDEHGDNSDTKAALRQQQQQQQPEITVMVCVTETNNTKLSILGPDANTDFLVDNLTLYEVSAENSNWRTEADTNIEKHRKSDIKLK